MPSMLMDMDLLEFLCVLAQSAENIANKIRHQQGTQLRGVWRLEGRRLRLRLFNMGRPDSPLRRSWSPVEAVWEVMNPPPHVVTIIRIGWLRYLRTDRQFRLAMWRVGLSPWLAWRIVYAGETDYYPRRELRARMLCVTGLTQDAAAAHDGAADRAAEMEAGRVVGMKNWGLPPINGETLGRLLQDAEEVARVSIPIVYRLDDRSGLNVQTRWRLEADRLRLCVTSLGSVCPWQWFRAKRALNHSWSPLTALALLLFGEDYPLDSEREIATALDLPPDFLAKLMAASEGCGKSNPTVRAFRAELLEGLGVRESLAWELLPKIGVN